MSDKTLAEKIQEVAKDLWDASETGDGAGPGRCGDNAQALDAIADDAEKLWAAFQCARYEVKELQRYGDDARGAYVDQLRERVSRSEAMLRAVANQSWNPEDLRALLQEVEQ